MNKDDLRAMVRCDKQANRYTKLPQAVIDMIRDLAEIAEVLPSTSPANAACSLDRLVTEWCKILPFTV